MMRKFAFLLLLAGAAAPTMATAQMQDGPRGDRENSRSERADRPERPERPQRAERSTSSEDRQRNFEMRRERSEPRAATSDDHQRGTFSRQIRERVQVRDQSGQAETPAPPARERDWSNRRDGGRDSVRDWQPRDREIRPVPDTTTVPTTRDGSHRYDRDRSGSTARHWDGRRWGRDWRSDRRYDWRRHRDRHRSRFHIGFYIDPFGWSYRRYNIGSYMNPYYYRSNYWLDDPWQYRLPPVYGPYRWVRYHNDALLIDTWSGQVVDIIYGFFW